MINDEIQRLETEFIAHAQICIPGSHWNKRLIEDKFDAFTQCFPGFSWVYTTSGSMPDGRLKYWYEIFITGSPYYLNEVERALRLMQSADKLFGEMVILPMRVDIEIRKEQILECTL